MSAKLYMWLRLAQRLRSEIVQSATQDRSTAPFLICVIGGTCCVLIGALLLSCEAFCDHQIHHNGDHFTQPTTVMY